MQTRIPKLEPRNSKQGFTLVELLISMIILGVLIAAGTGSFMSSQKKGRDVKRKNDLRQVSLALEAYNNDKGSYPLGDANGNIDGCAPNGTATCDWGELFQADSDGSVYMVNLPTEISGLQRYFYVSTDGLYYQLYARLENTLDNDIPKNTDEDPQIFSDLDCSASGASVYCNYGISSTNKTVDDGRTVAYE